MDPKRQILILLSDTGGGHRASAGAIKEGLIALYGEDALEFTILDIWTQYGSWPFNSFVSVYRFASENPWCWRWMYESSKSPISRSLFLASGYAVSGQKFKKVLDELRPDLIISVHPLCQHVPLQILEELQGENGYKPAFVTVVTDLGGAHPTWFHPRATRVYVPSTAILQAARSEGVSEARLKHYGLPLRKQFWTKQDPPTPSGMRQKLNLRREYPTVLLVGGGEGVGALDAVLESVMTWALKSCEEVKQFNVEEGDLLSELQVIVVCGKNESTRSKVIKVIDDLKLMHPGKVTLDNRSAQYLGPGAVNTGDCRKSLAKDRAAAEKPITIRSAQYVETPIRREESPPTPRSPMSPKREPMPMSPKREPMPRGMEHLPRRALPVATSSVDLPSDFEQGAAAIMRQESVEAEKQRVQKLLDEVENGIEEMKPLKVDSKRSGSRESRLLNGPLIDDLSGDQLSQWDEDHVKHRFSSNQMVRKRQSLIDGEHGPPKPVVHPLSARGETIDNEIHVHAVVYGFVSNIDELMGASDLIVTKAGPGTIAEATTRGLPVLLSSYMPGQEEGNVSYVLKSRFGTYCDDAEKLGLIVREWLLNPRFEIKLDNMRYRSAKCANPTASIDIARDIGRLIGLREVTSTH